MGNQQQRRMPNAPEQLPDIDATSIKKQEEQFADLHNRLQGLSHQVNNMFQEFDRIARTINERHTELVSKLPSASSGDGITAMSRRLETMERTVNAIQRDIGHRDYGEQFKDLHKAVEGVKGGISVDLPDTLHKGEEYGDDLAEYMLTRS